MSYSRAAEQINSFRIPNNADQSYDSTDEAQGLGTRCTTISQGRVSLLLLFMDIDRLITALADGLENRQTTEKPSTP